MSTYIQTYIHSDAHTFIHTRHFVKLLVGIREPQTVYFYKKFQIELGVITIGQLSLYFNIYVRK